MIRVFIVDDEKPARRELLRLLAPHADFEVTGEFSSAAEASHALTKLKPDVIFLDIQMPDLSGLDAAEKLAGSEARIVFVTAYAQHSLQAFEVAAFDYLLKPVDPERFARTLDRLRQHGSKQEPTPEAVLKEDDRIFLRSSGRSWFPALASIFLLRSEGNYTRLHFDAESPLIGRSLNDFEKRLPPSMFFRANRTEMVNLRWIEATEDWFSNSIKARLRDGTEVTLSRRQSRVFRSQFGM